MKIIKTILFWFLVCVLLFHFREPIVSFFDGIFQRDNFKDLEAIEKTWDSVKKEIVKAPEPLISKTNDEDGALTVEGIWKNTNTERKKEGFVELTLNTKLSVGALAKADDMFKKGYFAHESPDGKGPAEVAEAAGYNYLIIGENLALGGFKDDADLVAAWMASPGHRENILRKEYKEIGIAVKKGIYEGDEVWIAVQEFGTPASLCNKPSDQSYTDVASASENLVALRTKLETLKAQIDDVDQNSKEYNKLAATYNDLVKQYNILATSSRDAVDEYNAQVKKYNACVKVYVD